MSAYSALYDQCEVRGWKVLLVGEYPDGRGKPGLELDTIRVVDRSRDRLVTVVFDPAVSGSLGEALNQAAVVAAKALEQKGLV